MSQHQVCSVSRPHNSAYAVISSQSKTGDVLTAMITLSSQALVPPQIEFCRCRRFDLPEPEWYSRPVFGRSGPLH